MSRKFQLLAIGSTIAVITAGGLVYANATSNDGDQYCRTKAGYIRLSTTGECRRSETPIDLPTATDYNALNAKIAAMDTENGQLRDDLAAVQARVKNLPPGLTAVNGYFIYPGVDLRGAKLANANLSGLDLAGAKLNSADLQGASLSESNLTGTDLQYANLSGANLSGANLSGANLSGVRSGHIVGTPAGLPNGWKVISGYLLGISADLADADLSGIDLSGVDLSGAELTGVSSGGISTPPVALPTGWSLVNGYLVGNSANLYLAKLANANLSGLDLAGANLNGADLSGANMADTNLVYAQISEANLTNANLSNSNLSRAYMQASNLAGANFAAATLWFCNLSVVNIDGTQFAGAVMFGVASGAIVGTPASLPDGWSLVDGTLVYQR